MDFLKNLLRAETLQTIENALGADMVGQINEKLKDIKIDAKSEQLIPKAVFDQERSKVSDLTAQLNERSAQLEALNKTAGINAELSQKIKDLQDSNRTKESEWQKKLADQERDFALKDALRGYKARDVLSVLPHLKQETILYNDGKFTGLEEQVKALQKDKSFLFELNSQGQGTGGSPSGGGVFEDNDLNNLSDAEYYARIAQQKK